MARNFRKDILRLQPEGPYHLLGECVAGLVVLEVASQLAAAGHALAPVILLDPTRPGANGEWANSRKMKRYYRALREGPPSSFGGPVKVISTRSEEEVLRRLGGNPFAPGQVEWIKAPGDHHSYIRRHHVQVAHEIARILG
jgi:thioesterase domain-containing protein